MLLSAPPRHSAYFKCSRSHSDGGGSNISGNVASATHALSDQFQWDPTKRGSGDSSGAMSDLGPSRPHSYQRHGAPYVNLRYQNTQPRKSVNYYTVKRKDATSTSLANLSEQRKMS